jgi:L-Lysine epsilon oxidase N-terminal/L-lysine epsilon oxidase C-terminal domain
MSRFQVFPAIGVARVGNGTRDYYLAPETPGGLPLRTDGQQFTVADFRDADRKLRRQAARFGVYLTGSADALKPGDSVDGKTVGQIEWTVHLANKKAAWYRFRRLIGENGYPPGHPLRNPDVTDVEARKELIIDPGPRTVRSTTADAETQMFDRAGGGTFPPATKPDEIATLGQVIADRTGALTVLGGHGHAGSRYPSPRLASNTDNDGWWDDTADGPVSATIVFTDGSRENASTAWVLVGPPAYAPQCLNLVTLYDAIFDLHVRHFGLRPALYQNSRWQSGYRPNFELEIRPILHRASLYPWVVAIPPKVHTFDFDRLGDPSPKYNELRGYYLRAVRAPDKTNNLSSPRTGYRMMPYLAGDEASDQKRAQYLTITATQYFLLRQWAEGNFRASGVNELSTVESAPGHRLTTAALENCVGGSFSPGVEMTWLCRNPDIYSEPFRIKPIAQLPTRAGRLGLESNLSDGLEPGDATKHLALPWQADFNGCAGQAIGDRVLWWWPAQRPIFVYALHAADSEWNHVPWIGTARDQQAVGYLTFGNNLDMVAHWSELGFVVHKDTPRPGAQPRRAGPSDPDYIEVQRTLHRDGYLSD